MQSFIPQHINEIDSPDAVNWNGQNYEFNDRGCFPFIIKKNNEILWGKQQQFHGAMISEIADTILQTELGEKYDNLERREWSRLIYNKMKEFENDIYLEGRYYSQIPAITYWAYDRNHVDWDDNTIPINLTTEQLCKTVEMLKQSRTSMLGYDDNEFMVQWNDKLIPYSQLKQIGNVQSRESDEMKQQRILHLAGQEEKRDKMGKFLQDRSSHQSEKLTNPRTGKEMSRAEYNFRRHIGDSKVYTKRQIEERIDNITSLKSRKNRLHETKENNNQIKRIIKINESDLDILMRLIIEDKILPKS